MDSQELVRSLKQAALNNFSHAIFPMYRFEEGKTPVHVGTCFAIEHSERHFLITAAHVIDHQSRGSLAFGTTSQEELLPVLGEWHVSDASEAGREEDSIDLAWHELTDGELAIVSTISSSLIEKEPPSGLLVRMLSIIGFPVSKNKKISPANLSSKRLFPVRAQYVDLEEVPDRYFQERGMSPHSHIAMRCGKISAGDSGKLENTISYIGLSGGPMISAGLSDSDNSIQPQKVVGVVLEGSKGHGVVVALRIAEVLRRIESRTIL